MTILSQWLYIAAPAPAELTTSREGELSANPLRAHLSQGSHNFSTALVLDMGRRVQSKCKLNHKNFDLHMRKKFAWRMQSTGTEGTESPPLETPQTHLGMLPYHLLQVAMPWQGVGLDNLQKSLRTRNILWSCEVIPLLQTVVQGELARTELGCSPSATHTSKWDKKGNATQKQGHNIRKSNWNRTGSL